MYFIYFQGFCLVLIDFALIPLLLIKMPTCCVSGCSEEGENHFPTIESVRRKWLEAISEGDPVTSLADGVVCDRHFCDQDFLIIKGSG